MTQHSPPGSGCNPPLSPRIYITDVPQRPYARRGEHEQQESIIFKVSGRLGISVRDAIAKVYVGLEGRDDQVFVNKCNVLMLRLEVCSFANCAIFLMTDDSTVA